MLNCSKWVRRTDTSHIECAKVILPKQKAAEAVLLDGDKNKICEFHDVVVNNNIVTIKDTSKMDGIPDGIYRMELKLYGGTRVEKMYIQSSGESGENTYCKESAQVFFNVKKFRSLLGILESNINRADEVKNTLQPIVDACIRARDERQRKESLTDDEMEGLVLDDNKLIEIMTLAGIESQKELKDCMQYKDGEIEIDKRILFAISYNQYQRQYLYNADRLKEELEARMKVRVDFAETATGKGKKDYDRNNLWEGIEHVRQEVVCDEHYYNAIVNWEENKYTSDKHHKDNISSIRKTGYMKELMRGLEKLKMSKGNILRVLVNSKSKTKVTKYKNAYILVTTNRMLEKFDGMNPKEIQLYSRELKDTLQVAIYCYLKQKGCGCYNVTVALADEVIEFYKKVYPREAEALNPKTANKKVRNMIERMYKSKGSSAIRNQLKTDEKDIFVIEESDYK